MLFIVSGPSGVGKTTLCRHLLDVHPRLTLSVSYTTRAPRAGEQDGVAYQFVDPSQFQQLVEDGAFAEHAQVHGNRYGTTKKTIERAIAAGRSVLFDIDYQGATQLLATYPDAVSVLILPPSWEVLEDRLRGRGSDAEEVVQRRLAAARHEAAQLDVFQYVVFNDALDETLARLDAIWLSSEARVTQMRETAFRRLGIAG